MSARSKMALCRFAEPTVPAKRRATEGSAELSLWWLGQAGFLVEATGLRIVIDPYLSDSLAVKYAGTRFPHRRMFPPPIAPEALRDIDWLLCTHAHTDHMDAATIGPLVRCNPHMKVLVPEAVRQVAIDRGVPPSRLHGIDAGQLIDLGDMTVQAIAAAHEDLKLDASGRHCFLGYVLRARHACVYHSGDTIPYPGLVGSLKDLEIDLALLPVNGRDAQRAANGIPGNLTLDEALQLSAAIGCAAMLGHHIDMFAFNTISRRQAEGVLADYRSSGRRLVEPCTRYELRSTA